MHCHLKTLRHFRASPLGFRPLPLPLEDFKPMAATAPCADCIAEKAATKADGLQPRWLRP
ncbi:hypothetical protein TYRP_021926 [Tyrophagus putrescentiae]|nr:hypothetical protein TYRP_021926 [Tyrophagus putrescentiae]